MAVRLAGHGIAPRFCHSPLPFPWEWELPKPYDSGEMAAGFEAVVSHRLHGAAVKFLAIFHRLPHLCFARVRSVLSRPPRFCHSPLPFPWEWELPKPYDSGEMAAGFEAVAFHRLHGAFVKTFAIYP
jgi:hypothetical protein